ncbi:hypothetical protein Tco_0763238 [Tanacetum coccineum]
MYDDVNIELKDAELADEGKGDEEMTDAEKVASSSRSVSSNYGSIFLNLDNISSVETEIISMLDVQVQHEFLIQESKTLSVIHLRLSKLEKEVKELKNFDHSSTLLATIKSEVPMALKEYIGAIMDEALYKHRALYHALMESILEDKDAIDKRVADKLKKRKPDDADKDEDPLAGPGQGLKRKKTSKDAEPSKKDWFKKPERPPTPSRKWNTGKTVDDGPTQNWLSDLAKADKCSKMFNELMSTPIDFTTFTMNCLQISDLTKADLVGPVYNLLKGTRKSYVEFEYNMEECYKALNDQLDSNNPEGDKYPFDLSKPLPLIESRNHLIFLADYFFNNDLTFLQGGSIDRTYTNSLTKTKATKFNLK